MNQQVFIIFIFTLILHTSAKLTKNDDLSCQSIENPFTRRYSSDNYQPIEQRKFQYDMLNTHNILRKRHCVPPLILDDKISKNAQAYAEYLAKQDSKIIHSNKKDLLGENLYSKTTSNPIKNPDGKYLFIFNNKSNFFVV
jgi:uncharacterized protein YkwD